MARRPASPQRGSASAFVVRPLAAALAAAGVIAAYEAQAATIVVADGGDAGTASTCTLRQAVLAMNAASVAGTGCVNSGGGFGTNDLVDLSTQSGTITLSGTEIPVSVNLRIEGALVSPPSLTISGANQSRVFHGAPVIGITVRRLIIANGLSVGSGGCINGEGHVWLEDSVVTGCTARNDPTTTDVTDGLGGGVATYALYSLNSTISGNTAENGGGGIFAYVQTLYNTAVTGNNVTGQACDATTNSDYCLLTILGGGGTQGSDMRIAASTVSGNTVHASAITILYDEAPQTNDLGVGGGISQFYRGYFGYGDAKSTLSGARVFPRTGADARKGARQATRPVAGAGARGTPGARAKADGYDTNYVLAIRNSTVSGNRVVGGGPNPTRLYGGGVAAFSTYGSAEIANSTISGNSIGAGGFGSGLYVDSVEISNSTITANSGAAGVQISVGDDDLQQNMSKRGNASAPGLAILRAAIGKARLPGATAKTRAKADVSSFIESTIVAGNSGGPDIDCDEDCTISGSNNLIRNVGADATVPGDTIEGQDPQLAPLANNGGYVAGAPGYPGTGSVPTHRLYVGSPAIDQGINNEGFEYEQRGAGYPRVIGPEADIGATEGAIPRPVFNTVPVPALGPWMLGALSALLGMLGFLRGRRRG